MRSCRTRSRRTWSCSGSSPISSRKIVPPRAASNLPSARWSDLVEEDRPAVGAPEEPRPVGDRAGEGAAHVAEELALDQVLGDRPAVDDDERVLRPCAPPVDGARDELLPRAALAGHEHRRVRVRDLVDELRHRAHRGAAADQAVALVGSRLLGRALLAGRLLVEQERGALVARKTLLELLDARDVLQEDELADPVSVGVEERRPLDAQAARRAVRRTVLALAVLAGGTVLLVRGREQRHEPGDFAADDRGGRKAEDLLARRVRRAHPARDVGDE